MKGENRFLRLLVSPIVLCLILVTFIYAAFKRTFQFVKFGGEFINYDEDSRETIQYILTQLKNQQK